MYDNIVYNNLLELEKNLNRCIPSDMEVQWHMECIYFNNILSSWIQILYNLI